jgi:hypothetical protein
VDFEGGGVAADGEVGMGGCGEESDRRVREVVTEKWRTYWYMYDLKASSAVLWIVACCGAVAMEGILELNSYNTE